ETNSGRRGNTHFYCKGLFFRAYARRRGQRRLPDGVEMTERRNIQRPVGGGDGAADRLAMIDAADEALFLRGGEDDELPAPRADVDLAVGDHRRGPDVAVGLVGPVQPAGLGIEAVDYAAAVGGEDHSV